jgi:hypothetical protein
MRGKRRLRRLTIILWDIFEAFILEITVVLKAHVVVGLLTRW